MSRRPGLLRRIVPWLMAAAVIGGVGFMLARALGTDDDRLVDYAEELRRGDEDEQRPADPLSALAVLAPLLERNPDHFDGLIAAAQAESDLTNWDDALAYFDQARTAAVDLDTETRAMRLMGNCLARAGRDEEAIAVAAEIAELNVDSPVHRLQLGMAYYKASGAAQDEAEDFVVAREKDDGDVVRERLIESFVTDIWGIRTSTPWWRPSRPDVTRCSASVSRRHSWTRAGASSRPPRSWTGIGSSPARITASPRATSRCCCAQGGSSTPTSKPASPCAATSRSAPSARSPRSRRPASWRANRT